MDRTARDTNGRRPTPLRVSRAAVVVRGFSFLELLLVLAVIVTVASIAAPRYGRALARYRVDAAARRVFTDLTFARSQARASSESRQVRFDPDSGTYVIPDETSLDRDGGPYTVDLNTEPYGITKLAAEFVSEPAPGHEDHDHPPGHKHGPGLPQPEVTFDMYGRCDGGGTVVIHVGPMQRTVQVDAHTGRVSLP